MTGVYAPKCGVPTQNDREWERAGSRLCAHMSISCATIACYIQTGRKQSHNHIERGKNK
jgi:hypothetical protein